jgi:hypothetical protein
MRPPCFQLRLERLMFYACAARDRNEVMFAAKKIGDQ